MDEATLASVIQSLWTCINFDEEIARIRLKCAKKRIARTAVDFFFRTCCVFCRTEWFFMWLWAKFRRFSCSFGRTNVRKAWRRWACGEKGLISIKPKDLVKLGLLQKASLNLAFGLAGYIYIFFLWHDLTILDISLHCRRISHLRQTLFYSCIGWSSKIKSWCCGVTLSRVMMHWIPNPVVETILPCVWKWDQKYVTLR